MMIEGKIQPQDIKAEQAIFALMLITPPVVNEAIEVLVPSDFYIQKHEIIFDAITKLAIKSTPVDIITLNQQIKEMGMIENVSLEDLINLSNCDLSYFSAPQLIFIIKDKSLKRQMIKSSIDFIKDLYQDSMVYSEAFANYELKMIEVNRSNTVNEIPIEKLAFETIKEMTTPVPDGILGLKGSGIHEFDSMMNGLQESTLNIVAARPSMGKSMLANTILCSLLRQNKKVLFWSLEMTEKQIMKMVFSNLGNIDYADITKGRIDPNMPAVSNIYEWINTNKDLKIIDKSGINVVEMRSKIINIYTKFKFDALIIDHGRLLKKNLTKNGNDVEEISLITNTLKNLAKELKTANVLLWQLNRESAKNKQRPDLTDLRGSGTLEEDADTVTLIHRPAYYFHGKDELMVSFDIDPSGAELIIAKNRTGMTGIVDCTFNPKNARFEQKGFEQKRAFVTKKQEYTETNNKTPF